MRTRGNGEELSWEGLEADIFNALHAAAITGVVAGADGVRATIAYELRRDAQDLNARDTVEYHGRGMQLGARVEHRVAVRAVATAMLQILGKDRGDGVINLGAAGDWYAGGEEDGAAESFMNGPWHVPGRDMEGAG